MSFDTFRTDLVSRLLPVLHEDQMDAVLRVMDEMSSSWTFEPASTSIIVSDGLPDCVRLYLASKAVENLKKGTLDNYYSTLRYFFSYVHRNVEDVTPADIRLFLYNYKQDRKISDSYLDHKRIVLNSFFEWLAEEDIIRRNPCRHVKPLKVADPIRLPLTPLELEQVRDACQTLREKAMVDFLYSTACRVGEFCALDISDVSFLDHTVRIRHGKGDKGRVTFLNAEAEVSLRAYLDSRADDCPALFVTTVGKRSRICNHSVQNSVRSIVSRCSISVKLTPHIFRHTAASLALQRGMPIDQVQKFLGHARIQTTLRYAKTLNSDVMLSHQKYVA